MKRWLSLGMSFILMILLAGMSTVTVSASDDDVIVQMIQYYQTHGNAAHTDIARLTQELAQTDPEQAEAWGKIMAYWEYVNDDMPVYTDVLPDGLPKDDSLCITVLGYALNADGTMKEELTGRLQVALDSAEKYPNAYIACTGGGTASGNPLATEADQMAAWLLEKGVAEDRIIVENRSKSTVQNAYLTYRLLRKNYPQITDLAIVTSDYHVPRGCLLYNAQLILSAYEAEDSLLNVVSNTGYRAGHDGYEAVSLQASGIAQIAGVNLTDEEPVLSKLTQITVEGKTTYTDGAPLDLQVTAGYNSGFSRTVTDRATLTGYDPDKAGTQTVTATYTENGITRTAEITITVTLNTPTQSFPLVPVAGATILLAAIIVVLIMKRKQKPKHLETGCQNDQNML